MQTNKKMKIRDFLDDIGDYFIYMVGNIQWM